VKSPTNTNDTFITTTLTSTVHQLTNQDQINHELTAHQAGIDKLRKQLFEARQKTYYSSTIEARSSIVQLVEPFAIQLRERVLYFKAGHAGRTAFVIYHQDMSDVLEVIEAEVVSLIALKSLMDCLGSLDAYKVQDIAYFIGSRIEDQLRVEHYLNTGSDNLKSAVLRRLAVPDSTPRYKQKASRLIAENIAEREGSELWCGWGSEKKIGIGLYLIEVATCAEVCEREVRRVGKGGKQQAFLVFSPAFLAKQQLLTMEIESMAYLAWPLVSPPLEWQQEHREGRHNFSGGYHSELLRTQNPLCRGYQYRSSFGDSSISFLNTLGRTPYRLNTAVFEVAKQLYEKGISVDSLIAVFDNPQLSQPMPDNLQQLPTQHPDRKEWRYRQHLLHEAHQKTIKRSTRSRLALSLASQFQHHQQFFLSFSNDYRGRAYPQQPFLQPQATSFEKALLVFAEGCALDERGLHWAKIALGAAFIGSKLSFGERSAWVDQNGDLIATVAADPVGTATLWEQADDPFLFLALCLEWSAVVVEQTQPLWYVPLQFDATCSGLQLLSGCLNDPVGLFHANAAAGDASNGPNDAYRAVVNRARDLAAQSAETAELAQYLNNRSLGKASLLVAVYGAAHTTRQERVIEVLAREGVYPNKLSTSQVSTMTQLIHQASMETFPKAFAALAWLKQLGKAALAAGSQEFCWQTPSTDTIRLRELERQTKIISTHMLGKVKVAVGFEEQISGNRMVKALPPAFVHALDASLLKLAFQNWQHPLATIHDCIAVLPRDADTAMARVREAFIETTAGDPLARLADDLGVSAAVLPRLELGEADVNEALKSPYLFN